jgi:hypothetical protein
VKLIAERRVQIVDALAEGRRVHPDKEWMMLGITIRHAREMALAPLLKGIRRAWRRTRQRGSVQRVWKAKVAASIRAHEVTDGKHGWHPHMHIALLASELSEDDRKLITKTWREMVTRELGAECCPSDEHAVWFSRVWKDDYLAKLGLETSGVAKDNGPWAHASAAGERYSVARRMHAHDERARVYGQGDRSRARFREYESATKGCRGIELDKRASALARGGEQSRIATGPVQKEEEAPRSPSYEINMSEVIDTAMGRASMMRVLFRIEAAGERSVFLQALTVAARAPPYAARAALRSWLDELIAVRFAAWPSPPATGNSLMMY